MVRVRRGVVDWGWGAVVGVSHTTGFLLPRGSDAPHGQSADEWSVDVLLPLAVADLAADARAADAAIAAAAAAAAAAAVAAATAAVAAAADAASVAAAAVGIGEGAAESMDSPPPPLFSPPPPPLFSPPPDDAPTDPRRRHDAPGAVRSYPQPLTPVPLSHHFSRPEQQTRFDVLCELSAVWRVSALKIYLPPDLRPASHRAAVLEALRQPAACALPISPGN
ncbi:hypothetical protein T492DRAFT_871098 [Pavlovales sp. CCMP2436]|nr:hypothetical protein T492DRAFT_871098 [Pavlovales sp. CCMP2436]